ncbi:MAG: hypothetical protein KDA72_02500 [Planctomycetales bacterium]|nr:hypothetical protein [Planctomycetales bacterium]
MFEHCLVGQPAITKKLCLNALLALVYVLLLSSSSRAQFAFAPDNLVTRSLGGRDVLKVQTTLESPPSPMAGIAKVSIVAPKPSPADRDLEVVIYIKDCGSNPAESIAYRREVRLAEGASRIDLQITFVQPRSNTLWDVDLFEDGRSIENKPPNHANNLNINNYTPDKVYSASLGLLAAGESEAEMKAAVETIVSQIHPAVDLNLMSTTTGSPVLSSVQAIDQASDDWRTYLSYDFIVLTPQGVVQVNQQPELALALCTCVAAGGSLLVTSIADQADLETVDQLFNRRDTTHTDPAIVLEPQLWWGTELDKTGFLRLEEDQPLLKSLKQHGLLQREFGFGVVCLSDRRPDQFPIPPEDVIYTSPMHGTSDFTADSDGDWFWRNLIRAVGKPPVWTFCAIVTLFGALLGPGLLVLTGRLHRRSLMIFLVPAISLVASLGIVAYGVLHEGFETHVRITSVQAIDGQAKFGFSWSRQNYFSGSPPREGLQFSPHTYARPVYAEISDRSYYNDLDPRKGRTCTVNIEPDQQRWSGWLRPRQQQQLLVGNRIPHVELPIELTRVGDSTLSIKNTTSATLPLVVVRGAGDDYYVTEQLAAGQVVKLEASHPTQAAAKIAKRMVDYRPVAPPELGEGGSLLDFGRGSRRYSMTAGTTNYQYSDILNRTYERWLSDKMQLPQFGFSVLATASNAVEIPIDGRKADDLHLIVGVKTW